MTRTSSLAFAVGLASFLSATEAASQQRPELDVILPCGDGNYLQVRKGTGTLEWTIVSNGTEVVQDSLALTFDLIGDIEPLSADTYLVAGQDSQTSAAHVLRVHLNRTPPASIVQQSSVALNAAFDAYQVAANNGWLYVYDYAGDRIMAAAYTGVQLPSNAADYSEIVGTAIVGKFSGVGKLTVQLSARAGQPGVDLATRFPVFSDYNTQGSGTYLHVEPDSPSGWITNEKAGYPTGANWELEESAYPNSLGPIRVRGVVGLAKLRDRYLTNLVVSEIGVTSPGQFVEFPLPAGGLLPGLVYTVDGISGIENSVGIQPLLRYGQPQSTPSWVVGNGAIGFGGTYIGNDALKVTGFLQSSDAAAPRQSFNAFLWVAARRPDGSDPYVVVGGTTYLTELLAVYGPLNASVSGESPHGPLVQEFPIPADESLRGGVVFWQWVVLPSATEVLVSDVFGSMITDEWIEPAPPTSAQSGGRSAGNLIFPRVPERSFRSLVQWLQADPLGVITDLKRGIWERARRR